MLLPVVFPESLNKYAEAEGDDALFARLSEAPLTEQTLFFAASSEDETWSLSHKVFFQKMLSHLTRLLLQEKLFAKEVVAVLQAHFAQLNPIIPKNVEVSVLGEEFLFNSFMAAAQSSVLFFEIKEACDEEGSGRVVFNGDIKPVYWHEVVRFLQTGDTSSLFKLSPESLWELMGSAHILRLPGLEEGVANTLKRYLDEQSAIPYLKWSCSGGFVKMAKRCFDAIDRLGWDVEVRPKNFPLLSVKFSSFSESALKFYSEFKGEIEELGVINRLSGDPLFRDLVKGCPRLNSLSLERTAIPCPYLRDFPRTLRELDLSMCPWLGDKALEEIFSLFPLLNRCSLVSNAQIGASGFCALTNLKELKSLDISRCHQVRDDELRLIIKAAPRLEEFSLDECRTISGSGFYELARGYRSLVEVNVARTEITTPCLIELAEHNPFIQYLVLDRAEALTFKGIEETLRRLPFLKSVSLLGCRLTRQEMEILRAAFPKVEVL